MGAGWRRLERRPVKRPVVGAGATELQPAAEDAESAPAMAQVADADADRNASSGAGVVAACAVGASVGGPLQSGLGVGEPSEQFEWRLQRQQLQRPAGRHPEQQRHQQQPPARTPRQLHRRHGQKFVVFASAAGQQSAQSELRPESGRRPQRRQRLRRHRPPVSVQFEFRRRARAGRRFIGGRWSGRCRRLGRSFDAAASGNVATFVFATFVVVGSRQHRLRPLPVRRGVRAARVR